MASAADIKFYLSGGAGNANPNASLGGAISTTELGAQNYTRQTSGITGLTVTKADGNALGVGSLYYDYLQDKAYWIPAGESQAYANQVTVAADGAYMLPGPNDSGFLWVTVVAASLPNAVLPPDTILIANNPNNLFDDATSTECLAGDIEYRCLYIKNTAVTGSLTVSVWSALNTTGADNLTFAWDAAGAGGTATTIADESTQPSGGLTWVAPTTEAAAISVVLTAGQAVALWLKRTVPQYTIDASQSRINLQIKAI